MHRWHDPCAYAVYRSTPVKLHYIEPATIAVKRQTLHATSDKQNTSFVFSGDRKIPTRGSTVPVGNEVAEFPTGTVDPRVEIFLLTLNNNDRFFFSHTITEIVLRMTPSLCLNMEVSKVNERNKNIQQRQTIWYQNVPFVLIKKAHTYTNKGATCIDVWTFELLLHMRVGCLDYSNVFLT